MTIELNTSQPSAEVTHTITPPTKGTDVTRTLLNATVSVRTGMFIALALLAASGAWWASAVAQESYPTTSHACGTDGTAYVHEGMSIPCDAGTVGYEISWRSDREYTITPLTVN